MTVDSGVSITNAIRIVFDNEHVVAVDKPAGVLTVPSRMGSEDPRPCLGRTLEQTLGVRLWPVHRLDLEVSGIVLFARTADAHRLASDAFESRQVEKRYEALCEGSARVTTLPAAFDWESRLVRGKRRAFAAPHGKTARTHAEVVARVSAAHVTGLGPTATEGDLLHFALAPETGRPHQLRVHLAAAGFPIVGDDLYGSQLALADPEAIALRSVSLTFIGPNAARTLGIEAPLTVPGWRDAAGRFSLA